MLFIINATSQGDVTTTPLCLCWSCTDVELLTIVAFVKSLKMRAIMC